jgi:hypothetical protein
MKSKYRKHTSLIKDNPTKQYEHLLLKSKNGPGDLRPLQREHRPESPSSGSTGLAAREKAQQEYDAK